MNLNLFRPGKGLLRFLEKGKGKYDRRPISRRISATERILNYISVLFLEERKLCGVSAVTLEYLSVLHLSFKMRDH